MSICAGVDIVKQLALWGLKGVTMITQEEKPHRICSHLDISIRGSFGVYVYKKLFWTQEHFFIYIWIDSSGEQSVLVDEALQYAGKALSYSHQKVNSGLFQLQKG